ncbi:MAG TPA: hypothetical protein VNQ76_04250 [Planctomicrobium sp.]|nr:hypothetical protein [Planctomicrobium sp.]
MTSPVAESRASADTSQLDPMPISKQFHHGLTSLLQWRASGKAVFWMAAWLGLLYGTVSLAKISSSMSGALCGPWGCTAPLEAVIACHLSWFVLLSPAGIWLVQHGTPRQRWIVGISLLLFSLTVILILCVVSLSESFSIPGATKYIPHRMALKIIGCVDLPLFAALVWGGWCLFKARRPASPSLSEPEHDNTKQTTENVP